MGTYDLEIKDYYSLVSLHKSLLEAKFNISPDNEDISGSPLVANLFNRIKARIMFRAQPKSELSKFINAYKSASSRLLKKEYPAIREKLWKEAFWSQSFCLLSTGGAPVEVIRRYIESQGEK